MQLKRFTGIGLAAALAISAPAFAQEGSGGNSTGGAGPIVGGGLSGQIAGGGDASDPSGSAGIGSSGGAPSGPGGGAISVEGTSHHGGMAADGGMPLQPHGIPATLDQAIQRALANNPDIRVAEANLRQAQAAYEQAKLKLAQQVMIAMEQAEIDRLALERIQQATDALAGSVSKQEHHLARFAARKSQLELQYLLGESPAAGQMFLDSGMGSATMMGSGMGVQFGFDGGTGTLSLGGDAGSTGAGGGAMMGRRMEGGAVTGAPDASGGGEGNPQGADRRKWYEDTLSQKSGPIEIHAGEAETLAQQLAKRMNVPVIVDSRALIERSENTSLNVELILNRESLTWRDVLTAIADTNDIAFLIRDYGILITTPEKASAASFGGSGGGAIGGFGGAGGLGGGGGGFGGGGF